MKISRSNKELFKRLSVRFIFTILILIFLFILMPKLIQLLFPVFMAYLIAAFVNPLVNLINRGLKKAKVNTSFSRNLVSLFLTAVILVLFALVVYSSFVTLLREVVGLANAIQDNWPEIVNMVEELETWFRLQVVFLPQFASELLNNTAESILAFIDMVSKNLLGITFTSTGWLISRAGSLSLNLITFFLSLYFIMTDFDYLKVFFEKRIDNNLLKSINLLKNSALSGVIGYIKTQLFIAVFAFVFMFIAFTLLGRPYALVIALGLAIVDLIPLIGTIAILVPWGIIEMIVVDLNSGILLVALGVLFFVIRRLIEPKIMGKQTGLHPLLALIGIYVGIQYSGLFGALIGPLVMVVLIGVIRSGILDNTFADLSELYYKTNLLLKRE